MINTIKVYTGDVHGTINGILVITTHSQCQPKKDATFIFAITEANVGKF